MIDLTNKFGFFKVLGDIEIAQSMQEKKEVAVEVIIESCLKELIVDFKNEFYVW